MVNGNISGVRNAVLEQMEEALTGDYERDQFAPLPLLQALARYTAMLGREISVYITRSGSVVDVSVGDAGTVPLGAFNLRRGERRLCGVRCIHTHPNASAQLSDPDLKSLQHLRLDAMAALAVDEAGAPCALCAAFLDEESEAGRYSVRVTPVFALDRLPQRQLMAEVEAADKRIGRGEPAPERSVERAVVVGLADSPDAPTLMELARLTETAGAQVAARVNQNRAQMDPATYIGQGKAKELELMVQSLQADLAIMDDELTGAQVRNLEAAIGCRVVDRTALILDIFAQRAQSREGKLQVELAQLRYQLPRLTGLGTVLSRLGGGIGTRGPGETKLEVDRRRIRRRITDIERELAEVGRQRDRRRERRARGEIPVAALVGYTNAGKSTLLNTLSGANVLAEDKLFATLDPVARRVQLPGGTACLLVDTVGFISKLPHDLVRAFRSTLEEALYADVLVIVQDAADPDFDLQQRVVEEVLSDLGAGDKPRIWALNKMDLAPQLHPGNAAERVAISAKDGTGCQELMQAVERLLSAGKRRLNLLIPYARGDVLSYLHKYGSVSAQAYEEAGTRVEALLDAATADRVQHMLQAQP